MAQDHDISQGKPARAPVSAHPAFPLIVGLWFAALLGLGTIVMPAAVLERTATATGLAGVFSAAEPPLTASARAMFALVATIAGLLGGLVLARRVAAAQQYAYVPRRRAPHPRVNAAPRPLSVHEDLGEEAIAPAVDEARPPIPGRRRSLAVAEDDRPSEFLQTVPVPGDELAATPDLPNDEDAMNERPADTEMPADHDDEAVDLREMDEAFADLPTGAQVFLSPKEAGLPEPYVPPLDTRKPRDLPAPAPQEVAGDAAEPLTLEPIDAPLEDLGIVQLAERLGRSLHQRLSAAPAEIPAETPAEPEGEPLEFSAPSLDHEATETLHEGAPSVPPPVVPDALRAFMDSPPEDLVPPPAAAEPEPLTVPAPVVPEALRPFTFDPFEADDDEDADDPGPFTLPLGGLARPFAAPPADTLPEDDEDGAEDALPEAEESYSSLLAMHNPFRAREEFVRVDEPEADDDAIEPAVVFPGQEPPTVEPEPVAEEPAPAPPVRPFDAPHQAAPSTAPARPAADPVETERALRSALANLQRMSGAA